MVACRGRAVSSRRRFATRLYGKLPGSISPHHARNQRLRHIGGAQAGNASQALAAS
jgi:hypothetical protein